MKGFPPRPQPEEPFPGRLTAARRSPRPWRLFCFLSAEFRLFNGKSPKKTAINEIL
jgi:hypothetical protein